MIDLTAPSIYEKVIQETDTEQVRLVINTFRETEYISIRKYYLDFEEEWKPSRDGITMPIDFTNTRNLLAGMLEIVSLAESKEVIEKEFKDVLDQIYQIKNDMQAIFFYLPNLSSQFSGFLFSNESMKSKISSKELDIKKSS